MVWHTKSSLPLLTPQVELFVHRYLKQRLVQTTFAVPAALRQASRSVSFMPVAISVS